MIIILIDIDFFFLFCTLNIVLKSLYIQMQIVINAKLQAAQYYDDYNIECILLINR